MDLVQHKAFVGIHVELLVCWKQIYERKENVKAVVSLRVAGLPLSTLTHCILHSMSDIGLRAVDLLKLSRLDFSCSISINTPNSMFSPADYLYEYVVYNSLAPKDIDLIYCSSHHT
jgi:hypothetical protein